jgi:integrase
MSTEPARTFPPTEWTHVHVKNAPPGVHTVAPGLRLQVTPGADGELRRSWTVRFSLAGRTREAGAGAFPEVSLAAARRVALEWRAAARAGVDPLAERDRRRAEAAAAAARRVTFAEAARAYVDAHAAGWRNPKHRAQWAATFDAYVFPVFGAVDVAAVDADAVLAALRPIWTEKPETASRLRGRIERVLDWATARKLRTGENPARWRGHLAALLPARSKVARVKAHAALPWRDAPAFWRDLATRDGMGANALKFAILTAARSGEVRGATWGEVDLHAATWTVPGERMKAGRAHAAPLSAPAVDLLRARAPAVADPGALVFRGQSGGPLSDMTLAAVLRRMGRAEVTVHGFRSTFKDWAAEATGFDNIVSEAALAHVIPDRVEAAYRRGSLLEKRRALMADWADYLTGGAA